MCIDFNDMYAVSYTHLDVYKRQTTPGTNGSDTSRSWLTPPVFSISTPPLPSPFPFPPRILSLIHISLIRRSIRHALRRRAGSARVIAARAVHQDVQPSPFFRCV